ncbi:hypothetical protein ACFLT2_07840 [Acidobacteriota bacterium]
MIDKQIEVQIFPHVTKCFEDLDAAITIFRKFLDEGSAFDMAEYYKARNYVKEAGAQFQGALKNAKKYLGPLPEYASKEVMQRRTELLDKQNILAKGQEFEALKSELLQDHLLKEWLTEQEIEDSLGSHFHSQQEGKRKLANIKIRMVLDKLQDLLAQAKEMQKEAFAKQQGAT